MNRHTIIKEQTREKIHSAFVDLLQTREYNDITVREIAEHADIGFKTFYRHYNDKDDLTKALYQQLWQNLLNQITLASADVGDNATNIRQILHVTQENAYLMRAIIAIRSYTDLLPEAPRKFARVQIQQFHPEVFSNADATHQKLLDAITDRFISGHLDLMKWWVEDDFSLPIDAMTTLILKLVVEPIISLDIPAIMEDCEPSQR